MRAEWDLLNRVPAYSMLLLLCVCVCVNFKCPSPIIDFFKLVPKNSANMLFYTGLLHQLFDVKYFSNLFCIPVNI